MIDISTLTGNQILAIAPDKPELLFTEDGAKAEYRKLVSKWHPDQNPDVDEAVIAHINVLYQLAVFRIGMDSWVIPNTVTFKTVDGKKFNFKYRSTRGFELGDIYVGDNLVAYSLFKDNEDLYKIARSRIKSFTFADDKMQAKIEKHLPVIHSELETEERLVMLIKKTPDMLLLSDVLDYFKSNFMSVVDPTTYSPTIPKMHPKHAAWVISRMFNLTCYMKYLGVVQSGITLDSCFITPSSHAVSLLGGWWYSAETGKRLKALPATAVEYAPNDVISEQVADYRIDLEMVKAAGRELLGDIVGSKFIMDKTIPAPMANWLREPAKEDPFKEFDVWQNKVLTDSFGPRKFVELDLTADMLYGAK